MRNLLAPGGYRHDRQCHRDPLSVSGTLNLTNKTGSSSIHAQAFVTKALDCAHELRFRNGGFFVSGQRHAIGIGSYTSGNVTIVENGTGLDDVLVTVPLSGAVRRFVWLVVELL